MGVLLLLSKNKTILFTFLLCNFLDHNLYCVQKFLGVLLFGIVLKVSSFIGYKCFANWGVMIANHERGREGEREMQLFYSCGDLALYLVAVQPSSALEL